MVTKNNEHVIKLKLDRYDVETQIFHFDVEDNDGQPYYVPASMSINMATYIFGRKQTEELVPGIWVALTCICERIT